jgi:GxxExxY protein
MSADKLQFSKLTEQVIGAFYDVANELGFGFLESVYQRAMLIRLRELSLKVEAEVAVPVFYHGEQIGDFRADLIVEDVVLLELKAAEKLVAAHQAQTLHYLKATDFEVALLMNFGATKPEFKRLIFENSRKRLKARAASASSDHSA